MAHAQIDAYTSLRAPLGAWLVAAFVAVASGVLAHAPVQALPATIATLTAGTLLVVWGTAAGRAFEERLSLAHLAWYHAWRIVPGAAFLVLYARGALPWAFAVPGGIGDIAVGLLAPLAARAALSPRLAGRLAFVAWTAFGFFDLAGVVGTAFVLSRADPSSIHLLRELPLGLLPTFAVPLTFAAHAIALRKIARASGGASARDRGSPGRRS
jgi:hypothetical protein